MRVNKVCKVLLKAYFAQDQKAFAAQLLEVSGDELPHIDALLNEQLTNCREEYETVAPSQE